MTMVISTLIYVVSVVLLKGDCESSQMTIYVECGEP